MLKHISENLKKELIKSLCNRYDKNQRILNDRLSKMYYDEWMLEDLRNENKRIDEMINQLKED